MAIMADADQHPITSGGTWFRSPVRRRSWMLFISFNELTKR